MGYGNKLQATSYTTAFQDKGRHTMKDDIDAIGKNFSGPLKEGSLEVAMVSLSRTSLERHQDLMKQIRPMRSILTSSYCAEYYSTGEPNSEDCVREGLQRRLKEIKVILMGVDARSVRPMRAMVTGKADPSDVEELHFLEDYARAIRDEAIMVAKSLRELKSAPNQTPALQKAQ